MPTIKVDAAVYEHLQGHVRDPFVDTPNGVLRRLLGIDKLGGESATKQRPHQLTPIQMRKAALEEIEGALLTRLGTSGPLVHSAGGAEIGRRGPKEQRYVTPGGQVIYLRTRSYDPNKPAFFTVQPTTLADADWYVFVCGGRGVVVMPGSELRTLAPRLYPDQGGNYKPTFLVDPARCDIYLKGGETRSVAEWREAYQAIAESEPSSGDRQRGRAGASRRADP